MLSCAVKRCRGRLCTESLVIFFLLPLQFVLSSSRCDNNNMVVSQTKHSHTVAAGLIGLWHPSCTLQRHLSCPHMLTKGVVQCLLTWILENKLGVMRVVKHTHSYSILIHPVRRCHKQGVVKHAVNVRASKKHNYRGPRLNNLNSIIIDLYPNSSERYIKI